MTDFIIGLEREDLPVLVGLAGLAVVVLFYGLAWLFQGRPVEKPIPEPDYIPPSTVGPAVYRRIIVSARPTPGKAWDTSAFCAAVLNLAAKGAISVIEFDNERFKLTRTTGNGEMDTLSPGEIAAVETLFGSESSPSYVIRAEHHAITDAVRTCFRRSAKEDFEALYFSKNKMALSIGTALSALTVGAMAAVSIHGLAVGATAVVIAMLGFAIYPLALGAWTSWRRGEGAVMSLASAVAFVTGIAALSLNMLSEAISAWTSDSPLTEIVVIILVICTNMAFYHGLKSPSALGRDVTNHAEGLRLYLQAGGRDSPESESRTTPSTELFERLLPYAIALNSELDWAKQFERAQRQRGQTKKFQAYQPSWFHSPYRSWPTPVSFAAGFIPLFCKCLADAAYPPGLSHGEK